MRKGVRMYNENIRNTIENAINMRDRNEHNKAVAYLKGMLKDAEEDCDKVALLLEIGRTLSEIEELSVAFDVFIKAYDIMMRRIDAGVDLDHIEIDHTLEILNALYVISEYTNVYSKSYWEAYLNFSNKYGVVFNGNTDYLRFKGYSDFGAEFVNAVNNIGFIGSSEFVALHEKLGKKENDFIKALWSMVKGSFGNALKLSGYENTPFSPMVDVIKNVAENISSENVFINFEGINTDKVMLGVINALAEVLIIKENYSGAIRLIESINDSRRFESRINYIKAMAYFRLGKRDEASEILIEMEKMYGEFIPLFTVYADYFMLKEKIEGKYLFWGAGLPKELVDGYESLIENGLAHKKSFVQRFWESKGFRNAVRCAYIYGSKYIGEVTNILSEDWKARDFLLDMLIMSAYDNGVAKLAIQSSLAPYVDEIRYTYYKLYVCYKVHHNIGLSEEFDTARYMALAYVALKDVSAIDKVDGIVKSIYEIGGDYPIWKTVVTVLGVLFDYSEIKDVIHITRDEFMRYMREYKSKVGSPM